ncbi:MAG: Hint domain-containing protein, partial [Deltaproteobacteria bacterium]
ITLVVTDDDPIFHDGAVDTSVSPPDDGNGLTHGDDNNQVLAVAVTINGILYPAGTKIELEFAMTATANTTGGTQHTVYYVRLGGTTDFDNSGTGTTPTNAGVNVGIAGPQHDPLIVSTPGNRVTYTIGTTATDLTNTTFDSIYCFTLGTLIETPDGKRLIDDLEIGDLVTTLDHGSQAIRWIGTRKITMLDMMANAELRPVRFETGAIGNDRPLMVSPQHRMLLNDWRAQVYFGEEQVLIAAKGLINGTTIKQVSPATGVTYCHLLFDQHEILIADGALSESFHPGDVGLESLTDAQLDEIILLFPELVDRVSTRNAAYPVIKTADARGLRLVG